MPGKLLGKLALIIIFLVIVGIFYFTQKPGKLPDSFDIASERIYWRNRLLKENPNRVYQAFKDKYANVDFTVQHSGAHLFGELLFNNFGADGISVCDSTFSFGCYHGLFTNAINKEGIKIAKKLNDSCIKKYPGGPSACQHGIGHGILEYMGTNHLTDALNVCQSLSTAPLYGCKAGVFMEYNVPLVFDSGPPHIQTRKFDPLQPYSPCPALPADFHQACYYELVQFWDKFIDFDKIGALCKAIPDTDERIACYKGVGNNAGPSVNFDIDRAKSICKKMPEDQGYQNCISEVHENV